MLSDIAECDRLAALSPRLPSLTIGEQVTTIRDLESRSFPWMLSLLSKSYLVTT